MSIATKLGRMVTYFVGLQATKLYSVLITWFLQGDVTNKNHYISTTRVPMVTKFGSMVTCLDGFLPIKSKDPLSILFCKIM